jgi:hypothetical protein
MKVCGKKEHYEENKEEEDNLDVVIGTRGNIKGGWVH